jgi:hypothetical protein
MDHIGKKSRGETEGVALPSQLERTPQLVAEFADPVKASFQVELKWD